LTLHDSDPARAIVYTRPFEETLLCYAPGYPPRAACYYTTPAGVRCMKAPPFQKIAANPGFLKSL